MAIAYRIHALITMCTRFKRRARSRDGGAASVSSAAPAVAVARAASASKHDARGHHGTAEACTRTASRSMHAHGKQEHARTRPTLPAHAPVSIPAREKQYARASMTRHQTPAAADGPLLRRRWACVQPAGLGAQVDHEEPFGDDEEAEQQPAGQDAGGHLKTSRGYLVRAQRQPAHKQRTRSA